MKCLRLFVISAMILATTGCATPLTDSDTAPFANDPAHFDDFFGMADTNKDGMMSRAEFMEAAGRRYDAAMAKMKRMPSDKSQMMMKGNMMTKQGAKTFLDEWKVYSGS